MIHLERPHEAVWLDVEMALTTDSFTLADLVADWAFNERT